MLLSSLQKLVKDIRNIEAKEKELSLKVKNLEKESKDYEKKIEENRIVLENMLNKREELQNKQKPLESDISKLKSKVKEMDDLLAHKESLLIKAQKDTLAEQEKAAEVKKSNDGLAQALKQDLKIVERKQQEVIVLEKKLNDKEKEVLKKIVAQKKQEEQLAKSAETITNTLNSINKEKDEIADLKEKTVFELEKAKDLRAKADNILKSSTANNQEVAKEIEKLNKRKAEVVLAESNLEKAKKSHQACVDDLEKQKKEVKVREMRVERVIKDKDIANELKDLEKN